MPAGKDVRPSKWSKVIDLYDNGNYSAIWGRYAISPNEGRCLGGRWNGENNNKGFPNVCGNSVWHVENDVAPNMTKSMILTYISHVSYDSTVGNLENLLIALKECDD